jgi:hypothetical protein
VVLPDDSEGTDRTHGLHTWVGALPAPAVGLSGSLLVAAAGLFIGRIAPTPGAGWLVELQHDPQARSTGYLLAFCGLALLTVAWLSLGVRVRTEPDGVRRVWFACGLWGTPLLLTPPLFSDDVWSYVAGGQLVAEGRSPYVATPLDLSGPIVHAVSSAWVGSPSPYGPLAVVWGGLFSHLSTDPWFGLLGYRLLAVAGLVALAVAVPAIAARVGARPASAAWLVLACPFTLVHGLAGAHLDLAVAGLLCLAILLALRGGWMTAAVVVGAAAAIKAPAILADAAVVLAAVQGVHRGRIPVRVRLGRALDVFGLSVVTVLGLGLVSGLGTGWIHGLSTPLRTASPLSASTQLGLHAGHLVGEHLVPAAHLVGEALLVAVVGYVVLRAPARSAADVLGAAAAVMTATVLLSPVVHYWYFLLCLPFLACAVLPRRHRRAATIMTLTLGLLAPVEMIHRHLPFSRTIMYAGICLALLSVLEPRDLRRLTGRGASSVSPDRE